MEDLVDYPVDYADMLAEWADLERKRRKENPPQPECPVCDSGLVPPDCLCDQDIDQC